MEDNSNNQPGFDGQNPQTPGQQIQPQNTDEVNQPLQQTTQPTVVPNTQMPKPKKSKKWLIIILVIAIIGLGVLIFFLLQDGGSQPSQSSQQNQPVTNVAEEESVNDVLRFSTNKKVYTQNSEGELDTDVELAKNENIIAVSDDKKVVLFMKTAPNEHGGEENESLWKIVNGQKSEVTKVNLESESLSFFGDVLSPDGKEVAYFRSGPDGFGDYGYGTINLESGAKTPWYTKQTEEQPLVSVAGWFDDETLILNNHTCFQCDGPRRPSVYIATKDNKEPSVLLDLSSKNEKFIGNGIYINHSSGEVLFSVSTNFTLGIDASEIQKSITEYHIVTPADGESKLVHSDSGVASYPLGFSSSGSNIIVQNQEAIAGTDQTSGDKLSDQTIFLVGVESETKNALPFEVDQMNEEFAYISEAAYSDKSKILMFFLSSSSSSDPNKSRQVLYSLDTSGGDKAVDTLFDMTSSDSNDYFTVSELWFQQT